MSDAERRCDEAIRASAFDNHFAVDDSFARNGERPRNLGKPFSPVEPITGEDLLPSSIQVNLNAVAIVLDFMKPQVPLGALVFNVASWGLMNPRHLDTL
ncbi:hypothetical protein CQ12_40890 [Bradyrhizobium jicamae]|uniref:Uncharacterized protein n=1 Tax=Bradyrhizobium jicamae TaxID=280332 RepID=A0A0R3LVG0_9BRAD|nr:hypothetical protein CQ12_40890 [Bradyrhizobium jicamae]